MLCSAVVSGESISDEKLRRWVEALGVDESAVDLDESITLATNKRVADALPSLDPLPRIDAGLAILQTLAEGGMGLVGRHLHRARACRRARVRRARPPLATR